MNKQLHQYHPLIGYTFIPGVKARVQHESGGYLVKVNNLGFRCNRDISEKKDPDKFRILVFGDSYTAGDGVSNGKRYSDLLESMIPNSEVYIFGLSGTGTDQQYLIFKEFAKAIEYDLVIIGVMVENINRIITRYRPYKSENGNIVNQGYSLVLMMDFVHSMKL